MAAQEGLTDRQAAILKLAAGGCPAHEIAARLAISPDTVAKQLAAARRKTGASSTREAVLVARERGWLAI